MTTFDILIPTFGRADRIRQVRDDLVGGSRFQHNIYFIIEDHDVASIDVLEEIDGQGCFGLINTFSKNYAGAIKTGYVNSSSKYLFCGSDDLTFHYDWDEKLDQAIDLWFQVYGTNDLFNPYVLQGMHATHYLVSRSYLDEIGGMVDAGPGSFLNEAYSHNFTDTEFVGTAKARSLFKPVLSSVVEHLHYGAGKSEKDATYLKGEEDIDLDRGLYESRKRLWWDLSK